MKTTFLNYAVAVVFALGSMAVAYAGEVFNFAGETIVVGDTAASPQEGEKFEFAGQRYILPKHDKSDADVAALESADEVNALIYPDDDPDIVLMGR